MAAEASRPFGELPQAGVRRPEDRGAGGAEPLGLAADKALGTHPVLNPKFQSFPGGHPESAQEPPGLFLL